MDELKPCPFCGGEAELTVFWDFRGYVSKAYAYCINCHADVGIFSKEEYAIEAWNNRYERTCKCDDDGRCECGTLVRWKDNCEPYETTDGLIAYRSIHPPVTRYYEYCPVCGARVVGD